MSDTEFDIEMLVADGVNLAIIEIESPDSKSNDKDFTGAFSINDVWYWLSDTVYENFDVERLKVDKEYRRSILEFCVSFVDGVKPVNDEIMNLDTFTIFSEGEELLYDAT